ncbi:MAG: type IV secretion system protein, partial [Sphingomicrobium sp.]
MQAFCSPSDADRFAARLLADADCQAFGLVERGYAALAQPGGTVSNALTGLMVIAVAFFGYRLLLGRGILLSNAVSLTVKIGVVLVIATSWESWQAVAYNGLARAPAEIASEMLVGIGAPNPLESLEKALDDLAAAGVGYRTRAGIASPWVGGPA